MSSLQFAVAPTRLSKPAAVVKRFTVSSWISCLTQPAPVAGRRSRTANSIEGFDPEHPNDGLYCLLPRIFIGSRGY